MNEERGTALRVFVDGAILKPELGGIGTYIAELTSVLARREQIQICIATSAAPELSVPSNVEIIHLPVGVQQFARRTIWRERKLSALLSAWGASVLLAPTAELPLRRLPVPAVMVVHDLGAVRSPELYGRLRWLRFAAGIPLVCRRADCIVCVSDTTRAALREVVSGRVAPCVVIGESGRALPQRERVKRSPPYILLVGSMLRHKNVHTIVRAMDDPALAGIYLILAGPIDERQRRRFERWRADTKASSGITHRGFVDPDALAELYAGAAVVAAPSLSEGFGLAPLEAMETGAPVVASAIAAHREIGGEAAIYVQDPLNTQEWARALARVMQDPDLAGRLTVNGRERAADRSWAAVAGEMEALLRDVGARRARAAS